MIIDSTVTFKTRGGDVVIPAGSGTNLLELAQQAGVAIDAPCGGNGTCGKCKVRLVEGDVEFEEATGLDPKDRDAGWRLACKSQVAGDVTIEVPDTAAAWKKGLKVSDEINATDPVWTGLRELLIQSDLWEHTPIEVIDLELMSPTLDDNMNDAERLGRALAKKTGEVVLPHPFEILQILPDFLRDIGFAVRAFVRRDARGIQIVGLTPANSKANPCGIACDIGTTSVSMQLIDLVTEEVLAQASAGNAQIRYGADVINRIIQQAKPGGVERLREAIINETLNPLIKVVCKTAKVRTECVTQIAFAANTTMNHLMLGIPADFLRREPYVPCFLWAEGLSAVDIGLNVLPSYTHVYIAPNVGSYVGGDITAGALASEIWRSEGLELFIDLGTNGELVFGNEEFLMTCACSAGPAFEGGDIRCGMRATNGAIESVSVDADTYEPTLTIVGKSRPAGICGSGLIDLVAELFRTGAINGKGRFVAEGKRFRRDSYGIGSYIVAFGAETADGEDVFLNEVDIENFVRAKGAIFSAITVMLNSTGFTVSDLSRVLVAGGIGSGINISNAIKIGLFPDIDEESYSYLGNSSLLGARAMVQSRKAREKVDELGRSMTYLELSNEPSYMDAFVAACFIPHTDASLFPSS